MTDFSSDRPPHGYRDPLWPGEVAELMHVNPKTVTRWARAGLIGCTRTPGGQKRFPWLEVQKAMRAAQQAPGGRPVQAAIRISAKIPAVHLNSAPKVHPQARPGRVILILGYTKTGQPVEMIVTRLGYLDDLESAIQVGRAAAVVEAGMTAGASA